MNTQEYTTDRKEVQTIYQEYMRPQIAAKYLDMPYDYIMRLRREGKIRAKKVGGMYRFRKVDLDAYMAVD